MLLNLRDPILFWKGFLIGGLTIGGEINFKA